MPKQEGYRPPLTETPVEEGSAAKEAATPSIEELDALLRESESVATVAAMTDKDIDAMVEKRQQSLDRLKNIDAIRAERLRKAERYNPLKDLKLSDYERLIQEEMIDASYTERLKRLDSVIVKLELLNHPTADATAQLEKISGVRNGFRAQLEGQIAERQREVDTRRENAKNRALEHYAKRTAELERTVAEIESNPRVAKLLQTLAEKEMKELRARQEKERKDAETRMEQSRKEIIQQSARFIQSLGDRHANAFKRLGELVGAPNIAETLMQAMSGDERQQQSAFDSVRSCLITAIIDGEGKQQLKDPGEVVPWRVAPTVIRYDAAIDFLRLSETEKALAAVADAGDKQTKKLLEQREQIIRGNAVLRRLIGSQWIKDNKTNKQRMGTFWAAFETRKQNDEKGVTEARKKQRAAAATQEAAFKKSTGEILERGGFVVEVPTVREINGTQEVIGTRKGVVRLEKKRSQKGNDYWEVVEVFGITAGLKVGDVSPLDMRSFPEWLRNSAKLQFAMRGNDFHERLSYEHEEKK